MPPKAGVYSDEAAVNGKTVASFFLMVWARPGVRWSTAAGPHPAERPRPDRYMGPASARGLAG